MTGDGAPLRTIVMRGLRRRCPACGKGKLFDGFFTARDRCSECGFDFRDPQGDTWAILYIATGAITGVGIVLLLVMTPPQHRRAAQIALVPIVAIAFGATIPIRHGFAIAVHFWIRRLAGEL